MIGLDLNCHRSEKITGKYFTRNNAIKQKVYISLRIVQTGNICRDDVSDTYILVRQRF